MELGIGSRVRHEVHGVGVVIQITSSAYIITFVNYGVIEIEKDKTEEELEILELVESRSDMVSLLQIEQTLQQLIGRVTDEGTTVDLGNKWVNGKLIFQPEDENLKPYELPVETFFHKIVMVRDRLRVMEQRINASKLTDEEKVNLQQYITKIYGSLTSFNILFDQREHGFKGSGK